MPQFWDYSDAVYQTHTHFCFPPESRTLKASVKSVRQMKHYLLRCPAETG